MKNFPLRRFFYLIPRRAFIVLLSILVFLLSALYMFQVNEMALENYKIQICQEELQRIAQQNEVLETSFVKTRSLGNLESLVQDLNFESIDQIHYILVVESPVVSK